MQQRRMAAKMRGNRHKRRRTQASGGFFSGTTYSKQSTSSKGSGNNTSPKNIDSSQGVRNPELHDAGANAPQERSAAEKNYDKNSGGFEGGITRTRKNRNVEEKGNAKMTGQPGTRGRRVARNKATNNTPKKKETPIAMSALFWFLFAARDLIVLLASPLLLIPVIGSALLIFPTELLLAPFSFFYVKSKPTSYSTFLFTKLANPFFFTFAMASRTLFLLFIGAWYTRTHRMKKDAASAGASGGKYRGSAYAQ